MKKSLTLNLLVLSGLIFVWLLLFPDIAKATCYTAPDTYYQTCLDGVGIDPNYKLCPNPPPTCCMDAADVCPGTTTPPVCTPSGGSCTGYGTKSSCCSGLVCGGDIGSPTCTTPPPQCNANEICTGLDVGPCANKNGRYLGLLGCSTPSGGTGTCCEPVTITSCSQAADGQCVPSNYVCSPSYGQLDCGAANICGENCLPPTNDCDSLGGTCQAVATGCSGSVNGSSQCAQTKDGNGNSYICCVPGSVPNASNPCPFGYATCLPTASSANRDKFSDSRKVNEYVSWYLNGTIFRAEYPPLNVYRPEDITKITSFSGPLNKRLPLAYIDLMKINAIENASLINETTLLPENHNQIVVCASKFLGVFGTAVPHECYPNPKNKAKKKAYRLKEWEEDLSLFAGAANWILGTDVWNHRKPPLPWGTDQNGDLMTEMTYRKYYNEWRGNTCFIIPLINSLFCFDNPLISNEWSDLFPYVPLANTADKNALHIVSGIQMQPNPGTIACFSGDTDSCDNPVPPDRQPDPPANNGQLDGDNPDIVHEPVLYYPHTLEDIQLSDMLNSVFTPSECHLDSEDLEGGCIEYEYPSLGSHPLDYENLGCEIVDTRSNPGDNLFQGSQDTRIDDLAVYVDIQIEKIGCPAGPIDDWIADCGCNYPSDCPTRSGCELQDCDLYNAYTNPLGKCSVCGPYPNKCTSYPTCSGSINIKIPSSPKIPYAKDIWKSTVVGKDSTFRRIFPKIEEGAPVSCIADITGTTSTQYVPLPDPGYTPLIGIETPLTTNVPSGSYGLVSSQLYFPWQGTIYEYFLRGIQTALRPKGYGSPIPDGTQCGITCGELPEFGDTGDCDLKVGNVNGVQIPPSFAKILEAAGFAYKVPPSLIVGIIYGEGAFNQPPGNATGKGYDWTEENVLLWSTCDEGLPSCNDPTTSLVGFLPGGFEASVQAYKVLDKLKEFDPTITEVDPCNLWHVTFVIAAMLRTMAGGNPGAGGISGQSCYGIKMGSYIPQNCSEWFQGSRGDSMMETAIRAWEFGTWYDPTSHASLTCGVAGACNCATKLGGCAAGGFTGSACLTPGDGCEKKPGSSSHNGCVWNVAHGN